MVSFSFLIMHKIYFSQISFQIQVNREQFPILMAEAITIHKSQGRSERMVCVDVRKGMNRQKYYVAFSRATSLNGLYIVGQFNPPNQIEPNDPVNIEMARLRQDPLIPKFQFLRIVPENVIQIVSHNIQSIRKHITTVVADNVYTNSHIIALQESWAVSNESYNIPDFKEISRNALSGRPRAFGTINFCKSSMDSRISDRIEIEHGDAKNHVELSGYRIDNQLTIINVYNNPATNLDLLKETISEISDFIGTTEDVLVIGDFNHQLEVGNQLERFMLEHFGMRLLSPRESTTNAGTIIDGVFGKLKNFEVECFIYESYCSYHKPIVIRITKNSQ